MPLEFPSNPLPQRPTRARHSAAEPLVGKATTCGHAIVSSPNSRRCALTRPRPMLKQDIAIVVAAG
eukprot:595134-Alexandrium_andersonii.AAC.1